STSRHLAPSPLRRLALGAFVVPAAGSRRDAARAAEADFRAPDDVIGGLEHGARAAGGGPRGGQGCGGSWSRPCRHNRVMPHTTPSAHVPAPCAYGDESFQEAATGGYYVIAAAAFAPNALDTAREVLLDLYGRRDGKLHWNEMAPVR